MMFETSLASAAPDYALLDKQLASLLEGERSLLCNAAQFSAFIYQALADINWAGFYLLRGEALVLGPFQGKVACVRIPLGRGVCGTAAQQRETVRVANVHEFAGHIACDAASNAEIVLPIIKDGTLLGVFDIDSPRLARFSPADQAGLEMLLGRFLAMTDF